MNGVNLMMGRWLLVVMMMAALMVPLQSQAQSQTPEAMIRDNVESLMSELEGRKDYYANNLSELEALVDSNLEQVADFRYIGASVMGNYFRNASPEQRRRFVDVFRQTLIDTYTRGLVTFDYDELRVLNAQQAQRYDEASVAMEVVANNGKVYPVSYSLRLSDGEWRVVNVIVNGINLGLTFRNQFDQAMRDNNRDYDAVIEGWSPEVGVEELEQGGDA